MFGGFSSSKNGEKIMESIKKIDAKDRNQVIEFLQKEWGNTVIVLREGEIFDLKDEEGFVIFDNNKIIGLLTYRISQDRCEILSLDSKIENKGIGTALIENVKEYAKINNCSKLHVITTNDNLRTIGFYQKRGFHLVKL
jgi:N-acetylglutamate synthase-like GNAT family acetyltransferase